MSSAILQRLGAAGSGASVMTSEQLTEKLRQQEEARRKQEARDGGR
jgi:hypothetical protein